MAKKQNLRKASESHVVSAMCQAFGIPKAKADTFNEALKALDELEILPWRAEGSVMFPYEVDIVDSIYFGKSNCEVISQLVVCLDELHFVRDGVRSGKAGLWLCFAEDADDVGQLPHLLRSCSPRVIINHVNLGESVYRVFAVSAPTIARWQND